MAPNATCVRIVSHRRQFTDVAIVWQDSLIDDENTKYPSRRKRTIMIGTLYGIVLDCPEPMALAKFYQGVLGGEIVPDDEDWVDLVFADSGPRIGFQKSPGFLAPTWPGDDGDQQAHFDIAVDDFEIAHDELIRMGARFLEAHPGFRVYLDLAGHPFCTVRE